MLWIDVTDTFLRWTGGPTGIQRTLIGLAHASRNRESCALCIWDEQNNCWRRLTAEAFIESVGFSVEREASEAEDCGVSSSRGAFRSWCQSLYSFAKCHFWLFHDWVRDLFKVTEKSMQELQTLEQFRRVPIAQLHRRWKAFRKHEKTGFGVKHSRQLMIKKLPKIAGWKEGDAVLLADSHWNTPGLVAALNRCLPRPKVLGFCYDIIQIERPDFVTDYSRGVFTNWLELLRTRTDEIICISKYSAERVRHSWTGRVGCPPVRATCFGNKLEPRTPSSEGIRQSLAEILRAHKSESAAPMPELADATSWILWIGSLDLRKNLDVLLLAAEHLISEGVLQRPIIVAGRPSAGTSYYQHKMKRNPYLCQGMHFIESPSDALLDDLKKGADLLLFTSWEEGYGLPVAEALQEGIPVIASKATSIPEVGGHLVEYFEPWNSGELAVLLRRFERDESFRDDLRARAKRFVPTTWEQMLDDILDKSLSRRG